MRTLKIKEQFSSIFILIMILALLSFFTTNYFINKVNNSYENVLNHSLPIMNKSSKITELSAQIETQLIQLHFDALNSRQNDQIDIVEEKKLTQLWQNIVKLLDELLMYNILDKDKLLGKKYEINEYLKYMTQLSKQTELLVNAKKNKSIYVNEIDNLINYNNEVLLSKIESLWYHLLNSVPHKKDLKELDDSYQFYKNSTQLLSYFRQVFLTTDISAINILKRDSVKLFNKMNNTDLTNKEYKFLADELLYRVKPIYAGDESLFKVHYDVVRLANISDSLIKQQINMAKELKELSDSIFVEIQVSLIDKQQNIKKNFYQVNQYLAFIVIISFIITLFAIWFLVNKNLIQRISQFRYKILELSKGNTKVKLNINKPDEIGDMEEALIELKGYVNRAIYLSTTDLLTGLLNQAQFKQNLKTEIRRNFRQKQSLSLAIIDIDYFKNYNDCYGHLEGDRCLKKVGKLISKTCQRAGEYAYRIGGEEFAIIMPNTSDVEQRQRLERLQKLLKESNIEHKDSKVSKILTISVGICSCKNKYISTDEFFIATDKALYLAKKTRNSIVIGECDNV